MPHDHATPETVKLLERRADRLAKDASAVAGDHRLAREAFDEASAILRDAIERVQVPEVPAPTQPQEEVYA